MRNSLQLINQVNIISFILQRWLKPGGKLLITDYACGPYEQHSEFFKGYIQERGYTLLTVPDYGKVIMKVVKYNRINLNKDETELVLT